MDVFLDASEKIFLNHFYRDAYVRTKKKKKILINKIIYFGFMN